jgi:hypothetical protein
MKIPKSAIESVKKTVIRHLPEIGEEVAKRIGREITKIVKKKLRGGR